MFVNYECYHEGQRPDFPLARLFFAQIRTIKLRSQRLLWISQDSICFLSLWCGTQELFTQKVNWWTLWLGQNLSREHAQWSGKCVVVYCVFLDGCFVFQRLPRHSDLAFTSPRPHKRGSPSLWLSTVSIGFENMTLKMVWFSDSPK